MTILRVVLGVVLGFALAFGSYYGALTVLGNATATVSAHPATGGKKPAAGTKKPGRDPAPAPSAGEPGIPQQTAILVGVVCGIIGALYSGIAFGRGIYEVGFLSILGYLLDMSWSLLNAAASLVWLLVCMIAGGDFLDPNACSQRSGTFVYSENPRGGGYGATTIGTTIAGGWSTHEETHVWQARLFGPLHAALCVKPCNEHALPVGYVPGL